MGVEAAGETPSLTGEFAGETHRGLVRAQAHPPGNQHQQGPICLWVAGEMTENRLRVEEAVLFPLGPSPTYSTKIQLCGLPYPGETSGSAPYYVTDAWRQRNMAQMKEQFKAPKIELRIEEIVNLSDAEFKTLVIKMLTEMVEYGHKIEERVKAMKSEIKENVQGTNSDGKKTGIQINSLYQKDEINIQPEQNEETRIQKKNEERLRNLWDNFKRSNI